MGHGARSGDGGTSWAASRVKGRGWKTLWLRPWGDLWGSLLEVTEGGERGEGGNGENQGHGNKKLAEFWG